MLSLSVSSKKRLKAERVYVQKTNYYFITTSLLLPPLIELTAWKFYLYTAKKRWSVNLAKATSVAAE